MQHDGGPQSIRFCGCGRDCCMFRLKSHHHVSILTHSIFDARLGMEKRLELRRVAGLAMEQSRFEDMQETGSFMSSGTGSSSSTRWGIASGDRCSSSTPWKQAEDALAELGRLPTRAGVNQLVDRLSNVLLRSAERPPAFARAWYMEDMAWPLTTRQATPTCTKGFSPSARSSAPEQGPPRLCC